MTREAVRLLSVGAGEEQTPAIVRAQALGYHVIATDGNRDAPGLRVAKQGVHLDLRDTATLIALARKNAVQAILPTPLGAILRSTAAVSQALGLPGPSVDAAFLSTDKLAQRLALASSQILQPSYLCLTDGIRIEELRERLAPPLVLKPVEGSGSRGVRLLKESVSLSQLFDNRGTLLPEYSGQLIESRLPGEEYGVDAVAIGNDCQVLALRAKTLGQAPYCVTIRYEVVDHPDQKVMASVQRTAAAVAAALDYRNCLFHMDITIDATGEVHLIETAARPAGYGIVATLLPAVLSVDPTEQALAMLMQQSFTFDTQVVAQGMIDRLFDPPGNLLQLGHPQAAANVPGVLDLRVGVRAGDYVPVYESGSDCWKAGMVTLTAPTREELYERRQTVDKTLDAVLESHARKSC
ncbi:MAG: ATP-grasp domain-containing protein [Pseudomonadota bacterium]